MKKSYFYLMFLALGSLLIFHLAGNQTQKIELKLMDRNGNITSSSDWLNSKAAIDKLLGDLRKNPNDRKTKLQLAMAYIQESRASGNHAYYDQAGLQLVEEVLEENNSDYEALCAKATILLSQHHFKEAKDLGLKIIENNPYSSYGYGVLTDANLEQGDYKSAIESADKMVSLRPDIRSYSRISYLREIFGDYKGSIEAMKMALASGIPGTEQSEWVRVYIGHLYELTGDLETAESYFNQSLLHRPDYSFALAGMGRVEKAKGNLTLATNYFKAAQFTMNDFSFSQELGDVYQMQLKTQESNQEYKKAIEALNTGSDSETKSSHGHYSDRELAYLYLKIYRYDLALKHALTEYNRRPENIDVNQTLAWVYYKRGEYEKAGNKIDAALKTNSKNPVLLFQAGLIKAKSGDINSGTKLMRESLSNNLYITRDLKWEAKNFLTVPIADASK